jgi:hypothetical protein
MTRQLTRRADEISDSRQVERLDLDVEPRVETGTESHTVAPRARRGGGASPKVLEFSKVLE